MAGQPRALERAFGRALCATAHLTRATRERFAPLFVFDKWMQVALHIVTQPIC